MYYYTTFSSSTFYLHSQSRYENIQGKVYEPAYDKHAKQLFKCQYSSFTQLHLCFDLTLSYGPLECTLMIKSRRCCNPNSSESFGCLWLIFFTLPSYQWGSPLTFFLPRKCLQLRSWMMMGSLLS